jgi:hypothetical protein
VARVLNDLSDEWLRRDKEDLFRLMDRYAAVGSKRDLELLLSRNVVLITHASQKIIH